MIFFIVIILFFSFLLFSNGDIPPGVEIRQLPVDPFEVARSGTPEQLDEYLGVLGWTQTEVAERRDSSGMTIGALAAQAGNPE